MGPASRAAFDKAIDTSEAPPPKASILGIQEAKVVADWTKKRARGERIPIEPPSMQPDGSRRDGKAQTDATGLTSAGVVEPIKRTK